MLIAYFALRASLLSEPLFCLVCFFVSCQSLGILRPEVASDGVRPDCEGGVATNRSSVPTFYMSPMLLFVLRIVFCFTTVCRVPDVRMTRARDSVLHHVA